MDGECKQVDDFQLERIKSPLENGERSLKKLEEDIRGVGKLAFMPNIIRPLGRFQWIGQRTSLGCELGQWLLLSLEFVCPLEYSWPTKEGAVAKNGVLD